MHAASIAEASAFTTVRLHSLLRREADWQQISSCTARLQHENLGGAFSTILYVTSCRRTESPRDISWKRTRPPSANSHLRFTPAGPLLFLFNFQLQTAVTQAALAIQDACIYYQCRLAKHRDFFNTLCDYRYAPRSLHPCWASELRRSPVGTRKAMKRGK